MNVPTDSAPQPDVGASSPPRRSATVAQPTANIQPGSRLGLPRIPANPGTAQSSGSQKAPTVGEIAEDNEAWPRPDDDSKSKHGRSKPDQTWLARDPFDWVGRKVRNRKTGTVYTVRTVFPNGRVELERSWMSYLSTVRIIRADFETYS
jgi:hypothetical protein